MTRREASEIASKIVDLLPVETDPYVTLTILTNIDYAVKSAYGEQIVGCWSDSNLEEDDASA